MVLNCADNDQCAMHELDMTGVRRDSIQATTVLANAPSFRAECQKETLPGVAKAAFIPISQCT